MPWHSHKQAHDVRDGFAARGAQRRRAQHGGARGAVAQQQVAAGQQAHAARRVQADDAAMLRLQLGHRSSRLLRQLHLRGQLRLQRRPLRLRGGQLRRQRVRL